MFNDQIIKEQDEQLTEIQNSVKRIKENSKIIHETIDNQNIYIKEIDEGIDKNKENMNYAMNKIGTLLKTKNKGQIKCFLTLICISLFLIFLLII
jgi:nitrogen fixation/metabolism regulation signal transduction histidine kinase